MKPLLFVLSMVALAACSDPPGWILWSHTYSTTSGVTSHDEWESYESFFKVADCKSQIQTEIALHAKNLEERRARRENRITIQQEKEVLKVTSDWLLGDKQTSSLEVTRFFCVPMGFDPRPKDPSTWILWEYVSVSENGKFTDARGPYFEQGFLTQSTCEKEHTWRLLMQRELEAKSKAEGKNPSTRTFEHRFLCRPLGVDVREEIRGRSR